MKFLYLILFVCAFLYCNCCYASTLPMEFDNAGVYWDKKQLNIYVEKNASEIKKLFEQWNKKGSNNYKFNFISQPTNADILVLFKDINYKNYGALTTYYYDQFELLMVQIILPSGFLTEIKKSDELTSFVIKHEIGHSLGIFMHSTNEKDVMYPVKTAFNNEITANDIKLLKNSKKKKKIKITKDSYEKYKYDLPYLADIYKKSEQYDKAIEIYQKILDTNKNMVIAEYSLGYCYFKIKDYKKAEMYLKSAYEKENNNPVFLNSYIRVLCKQNNKKLADEILKKYINNNPESVNVPIIKDCIHLISKY